MKICKKTIAIITVATIFVGFGGAAAKFHFRGGDVFDVGKFAEKVRKTAVLVQKARDAAVEYSNIAKKFSGTAYGSITASINSIINSVNNVRDNATSVINIKNDWDGYATHQKNDLLASGAILPSKVKEKEQTILKESATRTAETIADNNNTLQLMNNIDAQLEEVIKSNPEGWLGQRQKYNTIMALKAQKDAIFLSNSIVLGRAELHKQDEKFALDRLSRDSSYATAIPDVKLADNPGKSVNFGFKKF